MLKPPNKTYAFYPCEMRSSIQISEQDRIVQAGRKNFAILAQSNTAASVDGLDHPTRLEGRLDICSKGHCADLG
jgi:hypothetical protein